MAESIRELDLRDTAPDVRYAEMLRDLDTLGPGDKVVFIGDSALAPLLRNLHEERPMDFAWNILEMGPGRLRVLISHLETKAPQSVTGYLASDHRRLDEILSEVRRLAATGSFPDARRLFAEFECGLGWHIDVEDHILFPEFEKLTGILGGPTRVMRGEHQEIRRLMGVIRAVLEMENMNDSVQVIRELTDILSMHNRKEERVLYPTTDQSVGGTKERDELVKQIQSYLPRNAESCEARMP